MFLPFTFLVGLVLVFDPISGVKATFSLFDLTDLGFLPHMFFMELIFLVGAIR